MHRVWLVVALAACGSDRAPPPPSAVVVSPPRDALDLRTLPTSPHGAMHAPPRDRWPCAFEVIEDQGIHAQGRSVFHYGKRTRCLLPVQLVASGIYGCPEKFVRTDTDGMVRTRTFEYDRDGHLTVFDGGNTRTVYTWLDDRLVAVAREQFGVTDLATYRTRDGATVGVDEQGRLQEVITLADGRPTQVDEYVYGLLGAEARIGWDGDRPRDVDINVVGPVRGRVTRTFIYACR